MAGTLIGLSLVLAFASITWYSIKLTRLVDDYRFELTEKALIAAFNGDVDRTLDIITQLRNIENSESQISMIQGVSEFYAGNSDEASRLLLEASEQDPENFAAVAMLSILEAYHGTFVESDRYRRAAQAGKARPNYRDYDELFLAYQMMYIDVDESVRRLEDLVQRRRSSPIVHAHLAMAIAERSSYVVGAKQAAAELERLGGAWEHIEIAKNISPDNNFVEFIDFYVHFVAILMSDTAGITVADELRKSQTPWPGGLLDGSLGRLG